MRIIITTFRASFVLLVVSTFLGGSVARGSSTIDAINRYAFGANIGWIDWRGDATHGANIGSGFCSGYIYAADVGWINLGSGSPANSSKYQNNSATDFGVNIDASGNLTGDAYGANIGWISFPASGSPAINLATGKFSGYVYSANCGWISLSNSFAFVQTSSSPGVNPASFYFNGMVREANGSVFVYGGGASNTIYSVMVSSTGVKGSWVSNGVITAGSQGAIQYFDTSPGAASFPKRFYTLRYP